MSFLAPWMLAALPLAAIPIIIHLINQRRYQTTQWAAMMFLLTANKMNRGFARIRQWLILAFRTLILAALVFAVGRPLVSGGLGAFLGRGASTAIVILDRSPSMQSRIGAQSMTQQETGTRQIVETLETTGTDRVILIESNRVKAIEVDSARAILELPEVVASDKTSDLAEMMSAALDYIKENNIGQTDVWICSDVRESDWNSSDGRWESLRQAFAEMGRRIRFRLVASSENPSNNRQIRVTRSVVNTEGADTFAEISLKISDSTDNPETAPAATVPVTFDVGGNRSSVDVSMEGGVGKLTGHRLALPSGQTRGFGAVSIPGDANFRDNDFYFTFDVRPPQRCTIVTTDDQVGRIVQLTTEIASEPGVQNQSDVITPSQVGSIAWEELALLVWNAPIPGSDTPSSMDHAKAIESFVGRGGQVLFLPPPSTQSSSEIFGCRWKEWQQPNAAPTVTTWRSDADVLSATASGDSLPVGALKVNRWVELEGDATPLAKLEGDHPLIARATTTKGGVYFCTTTPRTEDSSLATDGVVLYVMSQRLLAEGSRSLGNTKSLEAGQADWKDASNWKRISERDGSLSNENAFTAGVYARPESDQWIAINRSEKEDRINTVSESKMESLFEGLVFDRINPDAGQTGSLVEEAWRAFLIIMLVAMVGEALLCLPKPARNVASTHQETGSASSPWQAVAKEGGV